jgi:alkane 1-monooxygenase
MAESTLPVDTNQQAPGSQPLAFFLIYLVAGLGWWAMHWGGIYLLAAPLAITFIAVPGADLLMGIDARNPGQAKPGSLATSAFRLATWFAVPVQAAIMWWGAGTASRPATSPLEQVGLALAVGMTGGSIGITVAHELIHRSSRFERLLGELLLIMVCYHHWATEHVAGHHQRVATREDPATARLGESLPAFMVRSIVYSFVSAWRIETARNARRGIKSPLRNAVLAGMLASCTLAAALGAWYGPRAIVFFLVQSAVAIAFLETINYIEHYGLERRKIGPSSYERVSPVHSWNSSYKLTNLLLFNLQRHSDHHMWPGRPYYMLRHHPQSPQLPLGYAGMALLAMCPPLFRRVMNPRVEAHRRQLANEQIGSANIEESGAR